MVPRQRSSEADPLVPATAPAAVLLVQALALAGIAVGILALALGGQGLTAIAVLGSVFFALLAAVLTCLAAGLARRRRWARVPAGVFEGLCLPIGVTATFQAHSYLVGVPVLLLALLGGGLLAAAPQRR